VSAYRNWINGRPLEMKIHGICRPIRCDFALEPDLVLTFSDLQAEIVAALVRAGVPVHAFNRRTVADI
jgi:hypothetical protein